MATLRDIKRRIVSVQKTQQITRAMRMVAAAKLRRAQERIIALRPYADRMHGTIAEISLRQKGAEHALLIPREKVQKLEVVVVTSDRGLAGAFNSNILKAAELSILQREPKLDAISLSLYGRRGRDFYKSRRAAQMRTATVGIREVEYGHASGLAKELAERYVSGEIDEAVIVFSEFVSAMTQIPSIRQLLPLEQAAVSEDADESPYSVEPDETKLLELLVPKALEIEIYRALLETQAGEHAARMAAMESATRNTEELIESLTLQYNRARQAAITKELVEIVTGAEAL